jgi:hypothetical protein
MRAGRLLHTTRDTVPEGLAGSGRLSIRTRCRRDSPCLLCCRDSFSFREGTQVGTSGAVVASSARRRRGTELCLRGGWASPRPGNHKPGASAPFVVDSWCARNHIHLQALGASAKSLEDGDYRQLRCRQDVNWSGRRNAGTSRKASQYVARPAVLEGPAPPRSGINSLTALLLQVCWREVTATCPQDGTQTRLPRPRLSRHLVGDPHSRWRAA